MNKEITILTPVYNRKKELKKLYNSLCQQKSKNFIWLIIDDGSIDDLKKELKKFYNDDFPIEYYYKENGGKHTALNYAFKLLKTELTIIVDSDDYLTDNATQLISKTWNKYKNNKKICGLCFKKKSINNQLIFDSFKENEFIENYNNYIINKNVKGDKAEVFKSDILKKYEFPEFKGEKFVGEGVIWSKIAHNYDMVFVDKTIYVCNYLDNGLTKSGRKMRINNPNGGMYHAREYLNNNYTIKVREKNALLYLIYARFSKKRIYDILKKEKFKPILIINIIPSFAIYIYWKLKYK